MKRYLLSATAIASFALLIGNSAAAQDGKEKSKKLNQYDEIIIKKKSDKDEKVTVEIKDGEVLVNGKVVDDYDSENISIRKRRPSTVTIAQGSPFRTEGWSYSTEADTYGGTRAFLGVSTEEENDGAKIIEVTKNSAAEKAGLKRGDIITKIDDIKVSDQNDIAKEIRKRKPEEKVLVTLTREGKEQKISATLGKTSGATVYTAPGAQLRSLDNFNFNTTPNGVFNLNTRPRLGISAQDTEDGKGVKILDVAEESAAEKAGLKKGDIITSFDGKTINSADDLSAAARTSRENPSVKVNYTRDGKAQSAEIKTPRKLKTTNL